MKKIPLSIFASVIAVIMLLFTSCSDKEVKPLKDIYADIKAQVTLSDMVEFDSASSLDRYYGITEEQVSEFAGGINNSGVNQEEIVLIKAADNSSADKIKSALDNRYKAKLNENKNYNPEQAEIIEKCSVEQDGLYVSMIISENADKITEIYNTGLGK